MEKLMLKLKMRNRHTGQILSDISERDIDKYDKRVWDAEIMYNTEKAPLSIIQVYNKEGKLLNLPIFESIDLKGIIITKPGGLLLKRSLTKKQIKWMELEEKGMKELLL